MMIGAATRAQATDTEDKDKRPVLCHRHRSIRVSRVFLSLHAGIDMESRIHAGRVCYRDDACDWIIAGPHAAVIRLRRISRLRATERPKNIDISPITAGPTRKPRKPTVVTAAMPGPGPRVGSRPAAVKRIGTRLELPSPATANPAMANTGRGTNRAVARPAMISAPLRRITKRSPNKATMRSPLNRPTAIAVE